MVGGIAWAKFSGNNQGTGAEALYTVTKGDLRISVVESGKMRASKSVNITCEVEGQSTIISIVPEGTTVKEGDLLLELDSADLRTRIDQQEIAVQSAEAAKTQASEAKEIQRNQNESDIKAAELKRDFAEIDLRKYTGEAAYAKAREAYATLKSQGGGGGTVVDLARSFAELKPEDYTDGDWHQQLLKARNDINIAEKDLQLKKYKLEGTTRLQAKDYVTETELKADALSYNSAENTLQQAKEAEKILIKYDNPKQIAKLTADYEESLKALERAKRSTNSQLAQKEADLTAKKATYSLQKSTLDKHKDQLSKTAVKAPQPGLVIYSSSGGERFGRDRGLIAEGEKVYERQKLIELPDLAMIKVDVNIHESVTHMIKQGQEAIITIEALPGLTLRGHVEKVALLPNSEQRWMNPDLTVYTTSVVVDEKSDALKPGMTAKVEIIMADLEDVLFVPVAAVTVRGDQEVCFVVKGSKVVETPVQVGLSNDSYIEIKEDPQLKSGLKDGDKVLMYAPVTVEEQATVEKAKAEKTSGPKKEGPGEPKKEATSEPTAEPKPAEEEPKGPPADMQERAKAFLQNMTPEQKEDMKRRMKEAGVEGEIDFDKMTPEQMREMMRKMRDRMGGCRPSGEGPPMGPGGETMAPGGRTGGRPPGGQGRPVRDGSGPPSRGPGG